MTLFEWLDLGRSVLVASAAITGVVVALVGLRTWRHQLKGKTEYELARRLLRAAYTVRGEFQRVRSPLMLGGEIQRAFEEAWRVAGFVHRSTHDPGGRCQPGSASPGPTTSWRWRPSSSFGRIGSRILRMGNIFRPSAPQIRSPNTLHNGPSRPILGSGDSVSPLRVSRFALNRTPHGGAWRMACVSVGGDAYATQIDINVSSLARHPFDTVRATTRTARSAVLAVTASGPSVLQQPETSPQMAGTGNGEWPPPTHMRELRLARNCPRRLLRPVRAISSADHRLPREGSYRRPPP